MTKMELQNLVADTVCELYKENKENFNNSKQIEAPLSSQIAVYSVIKILQDQGIFPKCEE